MNANFARALAAVLRHEGGYSDHPQDKGGPTNKGITLATYRAHVKADGTAEDLKRITDAQVASIYRSSYWDAIRGDDLPAGLDYAVFDFAVNSGPNRAAKFLHGIVNVDQDGVIGSQTLAAVRVTDTIPLIRGLCDDRLAWLRALDNWPTFGKGWERRVLDVRDDAVQMVTAPVILPTTPNPSPPDIPVQETPIARPPERRVNGWAVLALPCSLRLHSPSSP